MKKILSALTAICCMTALLTACTSPKQNAPAETSATEETTVQSESIEEVSAPDDKLEVYRSGEGTVYRDANDLMSAKLTQDEDGYHLAMSFSPEYDPDNISWFVDFTGFGDSESSYIVAENGSRIESDNITVHGCLECLRILDVSLDGSRAWDLSLYPVDNIPDGVTVDKDIDYFDGTLDNCDEKDLFFKETMPEFLDEEQQDLFANAEYLHYNSIFTMFESKSSDEFIMTDDFAGKAFGIYYGSFVDYVETVFTYEYSAEFLDNIGLYKNIGGELYVTGGGRGANILYVSRSFELVSQSDNEINFKLIAHYSYKDACSEEEYDAMPENEREYDEEYTFRMVKTSGGWRFSEFNYWI